jgi:hypothetical protein
MTVLEGRVGTPEFWGSDTRWTPRSVRGSYEPVGAVVFFCPERGRRCGACSALARRARAPPRRPRTGARSALTGSPAPSKPPELCC